MLRINKNYRSSFETFEPLQLFQEYIGFGPTNIFRTEKKQYDLVELINNIENFFNKNKLQFIKFQEKFFVHDNKDRTLSEILYVVKDLELIVAIKTDVSDTVDDIAYPEEEEQVELDIEEKEKLKEKLLKPLSHIEFYSNQNEEYEKTIDLLIDKIIKKEKNKVFTKGKVYFVVQDELGLSLKKFKVKKTTIDIDTNYNDDFKEAYDRITKSLNTDSTGIILLHGNPGCGKTFIIRHLTSIITEKRIIYIAPNLAENLAEPNIISFFLNYPNSILIIEDAENILKTRKAGGNQAVSNLLNLSDGLLGDALKIQIICTSNSSKDELDSALKRPGRLIAEYEFNKLTLDKTKKLFKKIHADVDVEEIKTNMTLAEIYNYKVKKIVIEDKGTNTIGFRR